MEETIAQLVQKAKKEDQEAISELYSRTYDNVYKTVRTLIRDEHEAFDIVQESYLKAFKNIDRLNDPEKFQAWVKTIASNHAKDFLKKKKPALFSERVNEDGEEIDLQQADNTLEHLPDEVLDRKETTRLVNDILGVLSDEQRLAIALYYYEEKSISEIAGIMKCSEGTVKSRLNYARQKIRSEVLKLEKQGTKLYSMAPLPFLLWLLRMAKVQGVPTVEIATGVAKVSAAGTAATAATTVIGETGTATGSAAGVGATTKVATGAAKAVATKVVAGTLAATMTVGAGAVAVNTISRERQNQAAHVIYEDFLDRYKSAFELVAVDRSGFHREVDFFWEEINNDVVEQNSDIDVSRYNDWHLDYIPDEGFTDHEGNFIVLPNSVYEPNMDYLMIVSNKLEDEDIRYAYLDVNDDGIDEMAIARFYRGELETYTIDVYVVNNNKLLRGTVDWYSNSQGKIWKIESAEEAAYVDSGIIYIKIGAEFFSEPIEIPQPECEWHNLFGDEETKSPNDLQDVVALIESIEGTYRIYSDCNFSIGELSFRPYHDLSISIVEDDIVITDMGECEDAGQVRQSIVDAWIAYSESANTVLPSKEDIDMLTIANLGTMKIPIQMVTLSTQNNSAYLSFPSVGFLGGEQQLPAFNRLVISDSEEKILWLYDDGQDSKCQIYTQGGQELQCERGVTLYDKNFVYD